MKLRNHLIVLVVATLLPVVLFAGILVVMLHGEHRATVQRGLRETARALAVALDGELRSSIRALQALSESEHLDSGDLGKFYDAAARARQHHPDWETVVLIAPSGRQLVNLRRPPGDPLPDTPGNDPAFREVLATARPVVTGLYVGPVVGQSVVGVRVPVIRDGEVRYVLSAGIAPTGITRILWQQRVPEEWTGAILDRSKIIVARSRAPEQFVGQPATADLAEALDRMTEGNVVAVNQEGDRTYAGFSRSEVSGWTVVLGLPASVVDASLARSLAVVLGTGLAVLALGVGVAAVLGRRIAAPITRLSEAAAALSAGDAPPPRSPSAVAEVEAVSAALDQAGRLVHEQAAELRAREQRLRLVTDGVPALIAYVDRAGRYAFTNRAHEDWFGRPPDALRGRAIGELIGDGFETVRPHVEAALAGREVTFETRIPHRDGGSRHVQATFAPDRDADGTVRGVVSLVRDVTGERASAAQLQEQAETLETVNRVGQLLTAQLDLEKLVQGLTDAATQLTRAAFGAFFYNVVDARGEAYTLYTLSGVPRETFAGFPMPRNTALFGPTFRGEAVVRIDDVRADPRFGQNPPYHGMPEGHLPVRSYLAVPVVARSGEVLGGLFFGHPAPGVFRERDERLVVALAAQAAVAMDNARLYEREQRARAEAEAASRAKDEFLATLSHELRTPLNAILGWTRILRAGQSDARAAARALEVIERNAVAQNRLIEDLLDVSRIVAGKLRLEPRPTALAPVVEAAVEALRPAAAAKGITLHTERGPNVAPVFADPARLQQVAWNLVSNAIKFTPGGGRVEIRLGVAADHAEFTVSDTGQGIPPDVLPHVFERFRQADSTTTRRHGGLGLGLALVKHLVEMQGGSVEARSGGVDRGAAFTVLLPLARRDGRDGAPIRAAAGAPVPDDLAAMLKSVRVLVVDDDPEALALARGVLEPAGADVVPATSASEALALLAGEGADVLVSDVAMPEEDGYAFIRRVRALPAAAGGRIPALAVTAYGTVDDRVRLIAAGFDAYLAKPVDPMELAAVVGGLAARALR